MVFLNVNESKLQDDRANSHFFNLFLTSTFRQVQLVPMKPFIMERNETGEKKPKKQDAQGASTHAYPIRTEKC